MNLRLPRGRAEAVAALALTGMTTAATNYAYREALRSAGELGSSAYRAVGRGVRRGRDYFGREPDRRYKRPRTNGKMPRRLMRASGGGGSYARMTKFHSGNCVEKKVKNTKKVNTQIGTTVYDPVEPEEAEVDSLIAAIAHGSTYTSRIGTKIYLWSADIKLTLNHDAEGANQADQIRIILLVDRQSNGTQPLVGEVLDTTNDVEPTTAFRNLENSHRFRILKDMRIGLSSFTTAAPVTKNINIHARFNKGLHVTYDKEDTTGTNDKIISNNIWLMVIGDDATSTNNAFVSWNARVRYTD